MALGAPQDVLIFFNYVSKYLSILNPLIIQYISFFNNYCVLDSNLILVIHITLTFFPFIFIFKMFIISQKAVLMWIPDPAGRDAIVIKQALSSDTLNVEAATEIICSRTPTQIQHFKQIYFSRFGTYLEHDIQRCTSGDHKQVNSHSSFVYSSFLP